MDHSSVRPSISLCPLVCPPGCLPACLSVCLSVCTCRSISNHVIPPPPPLPPPTRAQSTILLLLLSSFPFLSSLSSRCMCWRFCGSFLCCVGRTRAHQTVSVARGAAALPVGQQVQPRGTGVSCRLTGGAGAMSSASAADPHANNDVSTLHTPSHSTLPLPGCVCVLSGPRVCVCVCHGQAPAAAAAAAAADEDPEQQQVVDVGDCPDEGGQVGGEKMSAS